MSRFSRGFMSSAATSFTLLALRGVEGLDGGGLGTAAAVVCALVRINDLKIRIKFGHMAVITRETALTFQL